MNRRALWATVKKEFLDNVRNRWIVAITLVFLALAILMSYLGATLVFGTIGFQGFKETAIGVIHVGQFLVPIIGIMLGYAALAGEQEAGSLALVLSTPITRGELLLGKFLGLAAVLSVAILLGLGLAGVVIAAAVGTAGADAYLVLVGGTLLEGFAFLSIALMLSSVASRRSTALGGGVLLWFLFVLIYNLILYGSWVAAGGTFSFSQVTYDFPSWWWVMALANPGYAYSMFALLPTNEFTFGNFGQMIVPDYVNGWTTGLPMVAWTVFPLLVAYLKLRRRDL
jgi:ABC-type transport system involved in multi-copper enzyme maturation permease subunit